MISDIRQLISHEPFVPFTIHLADGGELRVPTVDHVAIPPAGRRVFVFADDDSYNVISPLMISRITVNGQQIAPGQAS